MALKILSPDFDFLLRTESIAVCFIPQVQGQETPVDCLSFETIKQQANSVTVQNFLDTQLVRVRFLNSVIYLIFGFICRLPTAHKANGV